MIKKFGIVLAVSFVVSVVSGFCLYLDVSNDWAEKQIEEQAK